MLVATGSAGSWTVDIFNRSADTWTNIGDLSSAGDDWTLVSLVVTGSDLTVYVDTEFGSEILVRVYNRNPGTGLVRFCNLLETTEPLSVVVRTVRRPWAWFQHKFRSYSSGLYHHLVLLSRPDVTACGLAMSISFNQDQTPSTDATA